MLWVIKHFKFSRVKSSYIDAIKLLGKTQQFHSTNVYNPLRTHWLKHIYFVKQ